MICLTLSKNKCVRNGVRIVMRGAKMNVDTGFFEMLSTDSAKVDESKCALCHRDLKSPSEWIRGRHYIICESCYRSLLYPERNDCSRENI